MQGSSSHGVLASDTPLHCRLSMCCTLTGHLYPRRSWRRSSPRCTRWGTTNFHVEHPWWCCSCSGIPKNSFCVCHHQAYMPRLAHSILKLRPFFPGRNKCRWLFLCCGVSTWCYRSAMTRPSSVSALTKKTDHTQKCMCFFQGCRFALLAVKLWQSRHSMTAFFSWLFSCSSLKSCLETRCSFHVDCARVFFLPSIFLTFVLHRNSLGLQDCVWWAALKWFWGDLRLGRFGQEVTF